MWRDVQNLQGPLDQSTLVIDWKYVCEAVLPAYLIAFRVLWLLAERPKARVVGVRGWLGG